MEELGDEYRLPEKAVGVTRVVVGGGNAVLLAEEGVGNALMVVLEFHGFRIDNSQAHPREAAEPATFCLPIDQFTRMVNDIIEVMKYLTN